MCWFQKRRFHNNKQAKNYDNAISDECNVLEICIKSGAFLHMSTMSTAVLEDNYLEYCSEWEEQKAFSVDFNVTVKERNDLIPQWKGVAQKTTDLFVNPQQALKYRMKYQTMEMDQEHQKQQQQVLISMMKFATSQLFPGLLYAVQKALVPTKAVKKMFGKYASALDAVNQRPADVMLLDGILHCAIKIRDHSSDIAGLMSIETFYEVMSSSDVSWCTMSSNLIMRSTVCLFVNLLLSCIRDLSSTSLRTLVNTLVASSHHEGIMDLAVTCALWKTNLLNNTHLETLIANGESVPKVAAQIHRYFQNLQELVWESDSDQSEEEVTVQTKKMKYSHDVRQPAHTSTWHMIATGTGVSADVSDILLSPETQLETSEQPTTSLKSTFIPSCVMETQVKGMQYILKSEIDSLAQDGITMTPPKEGYYIMGRMWDTPTYLKYESKDAWRHAAINYRITLKETDPAFHAFLAWKKALEHHLRKKGAKTISFPKKL